MDDLGKLGSPLSVITEEQARMDRFPGQRYQCIQIRHFLNSLIVAMNVFHPLTVFENFLESGPIKKNH